MAFVPGPTASRANVGDRGLLSWVEPPTGTKRENPLSPTSARLAVGPGTKATFCPGPKGNRDKWHERKAYFVVVLVQKYMIVATVACPTTYAVNCPTYVIDHQLIFELFLTLSNRNTQ